MLQKNKDKIYSIKTKAISICVIASFFLISFSMIFADVNHDQKIENKLLRSGVVDELTCSRITTSGASKTVIFGELRVCENGHLFRTVTYKPNNKIDVTSINVTFSVWGFDPGIPINHENNTFNMSVRVGNGLILKKSVETNEIGLFSFISNENFVIEAETTINVSLICSDGPATIVAIGTTMDGEPSILCKLTLDTPSLSTIVSPEDGSDSGNDPEKEEGPNPLIIGAIIGACSIGGIAGISIALLKRRRAIVK